jgi:hypothetical protein
MVRESCVIVRPEPGSDGGLGVARRRMLVVAPSIGPSDFLDLPIDPISSSRERYEETFEVGARKHLHSASTEICCVPCVPNMRPAASGWSGGPSGVIHSGTKGRYKMRSKNSVHVAAIFLGVCAVATPAFATDTSAALGICISRGRDCSITNKGDNYEICVNNTDGKQCVSCPNLAQDKQTCSVALTGTGGERPKVGVAGLLAEEYTAQPPKAGREPRKAPKP